MSAPGPGGGGPVLVAPDSFKGTYRAGEVAEAVGRGLRRAGLAVDLCPVADGGEGTTDALLGALGGRRVCERVHDPLGRQVEAAFALLGAGETALVETAAASGLALLAPVERDPWSATTHGTGELIAAAVGRGASTVLVAAGGSATVDGGRGALQAIANGGGVGAARIVVLCDVRTPWERCAAVYGPQKGADATMVARLERRLDAQAARLPRDPRGVPCTGAAGGLAGALWAVHGAELALGAPWVLDALGFDARLRAAGSVVCGEGRIDDQSLEGKIVGEIAARARAAGVPLHAVVGRDELGAAAARKLGIASVVEATTPAEMESAGERLGRLDAARWANALEVDTPCEKR